LSPAFLPLSWVNPILVSLLRLGVAPAYAVPELLEKVGLSKDDIDVYELNEAFASQSVYCIQKIGLDPKKVNPNGGAIAIGRITL
jgi:acetyl-CoA acetyltransferase